MKINVQVENDNKDLTDSISSSLKERTSMLKDFLSEMRKMQSMSMDKMMGMMKKLHKPDKSASIMSSAMRESGKMNQSMNQSMMKTLKSMADKKESGHKENIKSVLESSNFLIKAIKENGLSKPVENKTVIIKQVDNKNIENLIEAIKSGSLNRSRWIPSAS